MNPKPEITTADGPLATSNFFAESSRVQRLDLLFTLIGYGRTPLALVAPPGAGKSILLAELHKRLRQNQPCALIGAALHSTVDSILDEAQLQFTRALTAHPDLERSPAAVLIVDDADALSDVALQVILTPVAGQAGQVRVLLSGTPELEKRVHQNTTTIELLPFSLADTERFLQNRFRAAGITYHLTPENLQRIHQLSGGWPGGIITQARLLISPRRVTPAPPKKKVVAQPPSMRKKNPPGPSSTLRVVRKTVNSYWFWPALGIGAVALLFIGQPAPKAPPESLPEVGKLPPLTRPRPVLPEPVEEPPREDPVSLPEPIPEPEPIVAPPPPPPVTAPPPHTPPPRHSKQWLRIQTPQDFTLQLSGGNTDEQLRQFIRDWKLDDGFIAHTLRNGRDWYLVLYGVYPTRRQAEIAAQRLPPGIGKPWIRTIGSVQKDLQ